VIGIRGNSIGERPLAVKYRGHRYPDIDYGHAQSRQLAYGSALFSLRTSLANLLRLLKLNHFAIVHGENQGTIPQAPQRRHFVARKKPIAALCHGSLILAAVDAVRGRTDATYEALAPDIERAGGTFRNTEVVVEGNLVTARTWMDLPFFMREFLKVLRA
jgi:hypothetical protein